MEELLIKEKAKRYDEAIEKLRSLHDDYDTISTLIDIKKELEEMFPELKESEDERMMNQLHSWMMEFGGAEEYTEKVYQWIKGLLEKQGEYKPNPCDECININGCINCENGELKETEQKPAWSEEDEDILNTIINHFKVDIGCTDEDDMVRWLKSLKERYTWKPSEEQIKVLKDALNDAICQYDFKGSPIKEEVTRKHAETIESLYNDLKKLREE